MKSLRRKRSQGRPQKRPQRKPKRRSPRKSPRKKLPKKGLTVKGNIKNLKKARKNVKVNYETRGLFGVARGSLSFLKNPVKPVQTGGEEFAYLDPVQQHFPDPVPQTTANPPQIKKLSTSPKTTVKTYPSFTKNFHGSIHINCGYTKIFSNQL